MNQKIERIQKFYSRETALVTSPFITQLGEVDLDLLSDIFTTLDLHWQQGIIVDIGCGTGMLSSFLAPDKFYVGLDLVRHQTLQDLLDEDHYFAVADAQHVALKDETADMLMCVDSFEHYPEPELAASEFYRILKPDGDLFLSVPNYANVAGMVKRVMERWGGYATDTWAPFDLWKPEELEHFITPGRIRDIFSQAGFKNFRMKGYDVEAIVGLFPWIWHPLMPGKLERLIRFLFNPLAKPLVSAWPSCSMHNFFKISK